MEEIIQEKYGNELDNVKKIIIDDYGNTLTEIDGLENLITLEGLRISECHIFEIKGLNTLTNLKILTLYANYITEIKGLDNLTNLEVLNLSNNQITEIKGLEKLIRLTSLDLSDNQITEIKGLENLTKLKYLNLSNNPIIEIKGLNNLTNLSTIIFQDVNIKFIDYMSIPDSDAFILYNQKNNYNRLLRVKKLCLKVRKEIVKIIMIQKSKELLERIHKYKPDSDYVNNIIKPRFEEMKKE